MAKVARERQAIFSVPIDKSISKPVILKRGRRRVAALIPIIEYDQFVTWRKQHRHAKPKASVKSRRTRAPRKTGTLTDLIGIVQSKPSGQKIRFEDFMTKHGYEQIDRDDS